MNVLERAAEGEETDYVLQYKHAWITVNEFSVYITKTTEGMMLGVYAHGKEMEDPLETLHLSAEQLKEA
jgi:hypothetical protein